MKIKHRRFNIRDGIYHAKYGLGEISCFWDDPDVNEEQYGCSFDNGTYEVCLASELESKPSRKKIDPFSTRPRSKEMRDKYQKHIDNEKKKI